MKFIELIENIEKARNDKLPEHEILLLQKIWNAAIDCIADEWSVLDDPIRKLKVSLND